MRTACWSWLIVLTLTTSIAGASEPPKSEPPKFELLDGDRVVFLGNTLIEREQKYGYWELMLTMAWPERNVTFRNLGWSGDTVWGDSRAGFGTQADGFKALVNQVNAAKPTVIFVGYGNVEAFDGEAGLPKFIDGYNKLLDELEKTKARIVLLGPVLQLTEGQPFAGAAQQNESIERYSAALLEIATKRKHFHIDLVAPWLNEPDLKQNSTGGLQRGDRMVSYAWGKPLTTNGQDLTDNGYLWYAIMKLGLPLFQFNDDSEALRQAIVKKNELFFHRWRPQNETYLFGFRKHEQGKNAEELFAFDPLIEVEEKKIAELRVRLAAEMKEASNAK